MGRMAEAQRKLLEASLTVFRGETLADRRSK